VVATTVIRVLPGKGTGPSSIKRVLANSLVERSGGNFATLFLDAIKVHSEDLAVPNSHILAYAIIHEIIHLLRGPAHSSLGVMKKCWTRRDAVAIAQLNLPLAR
jgi:hypothetical protein